MTDRSPTPSQFPEPPMPGSSELRDRLVEALNTTTWGNEYRHAPHGEHRYDAACKVCRGDVGAVADLVLALIEDEAIERMADRYMEQTELRSMDFRNGMSMDVKPARALVANWVGAARAMLGDAPNYSETVVEIPTDEDPKVSMTVKLGGELERYAFVLQRVGALTPHQARVAAEERAAAAEAELERLRGDGEDDGAGDEALAAVDRFEASMRALVAERDELRAELERVRAGHGTSS